MSPLSLCTLRPSVPPEGVLFFIQSPLQMYLGRDAGSSDLSLVMKCVSSVHSVPDLVLGLSEQDVIPSERSSQSRNRDTDRNL